MRAICLFLAFVGCGAGTGSAIGSANSPAASSLSARISAGCNTEEECESIYQAAVTARAECVRAHVQLNPPCDRQEEDKANASELKRKRMKDFERAELEARRKRQTDADSARSACAATWSTIHEAKCESDITVAVAEARKVSSECGDRAEEAAKRRTQSHVTALNISIGDVLRKAKKVDEVDDLDAEKASMDNLEKSIAEVECWGEALKGVREQASRKIASRREEIAIEEACRKDKKCFEPRLAEPICKLMEERASYYKQMAEERANPSGVVNLRFLHSLGDSIQSTESSIKRERADYRKLVGKEFDGRCPKKG